MGGGGGGPDVIATPNALPTAPKRVHAIFAAALSRLYYLSSGHRCRHFSIYLKRPCEKYAGAF
jgi:hypothetical protein